MGGIALKALLLFAQVDSSDRQHMIPNTIGGRGKSFLASIVLVLFVFGLVQMLSSA